MYLIDNMFGGSVLLNPCYLNKNNGNLAKKIFFLTKSRRLFTKKHKSQLSDLRRSQDSVLCRPDKCAEIVHKDRHDYVNKLSSTLSNPINFSK
ncbi:unnamed protein product [Schistosoma mattheei]|uniref:Uncharacterized protein n=1 Tax=Schistosoma mattheei TaxID=31246 RepID=A0A183PZE5_9TREM|nr:unnamed protein product [Schistosoma mattheei]